MTKHKSSIWRYLLASALAGGMLFQAVGGCDQFWNSFAQGFSYGYNNPDAVLGNLTT